MVWEVQILSELEYRHTCHRYRLQHQGLYAAIVRYRFDGWRICKSVKQLFTKPSIYSVILYYGIPVWGYIFKA